MVSLPSVSFLSPETRRRLSESDTKWHIKLGLRVFATILSLIAFSLFGAAIPQWNANFFHTDGPQAGDWQDGMPIAAVSPVLTILNHLPRLISQQLAVSFLHSLYLTIHTLFLSSAFFPTPHPILTLVIDTLVLAALFPSIILAGLGGLFTVWRPAIPDNGAIICDIINSFARQCNPILYTIGGLELGGVILSSIVWLLTFILMTFGAITVHRWRISRRFASTGRRAGVSVVGDSRFLELGGLSNSFASAGGENITYYNKPPTRVVNNMSGTGQFEPDDLSLLKETQISRPTGTARMVGSWR